MMINKKKHKYKIYFARVYMLNAFYTMLYNMKKLPIDKYSDYTDNFH